MLSYTVYHGAGVNTMRVLVVQTWLHSDLLLADPDIGRRYVLRVARLEAHMAMAAIKSYEETPHVIPGVVSIRSRVWMSNG